MHLSPISQNQNTLSLHSQSQNPSSQSKKNWTKVAKSIALLGGLVVGGYSLYLLKDRLSTTLPPTAPVPQPPPTHLSPQPVCNSHLNPFLSNFCLLQDSPEPSSTTAPTQPSLLQPTSTGASQVIDTCFASNQAAITYQSGLICCMHDLNCKSSGKGMVQSPDGAFYIGDILNGRRHGQGTSKYPDGFCRMGTYKLPDRSSYTGSWENNLRYGKGEITRDGIVCIVEYTNGGITSEECDTTTRHKIVLVMLFLFLSSFEYLIITTVKNLLTVIRIKFVFRTEKNRIA